MRIEAGTRFQTCGAHVLWLLGVLQVSSGFDGGFDWTGAGPISGSGGVVITTVGGNAHLVTASANDAWITVPGKALYFTTNGTTWHPLS